MEKFIYTFFLTACLSIISTSQTLQTVTDADLATGTYTWTKDKIYLLDGYVFLEAGGVLNIEAGTVIKGKGSPTGGDNASALIISTGAQIFAIGTASEPIIFTAELDDISDPGILDKNRKGLWGGLIILGEAPIGVDGAKTNIEGIPSTEGRAEYGGTKPLDNSGVLQYVSIRHGGAKLEANNEINGLTLGGVGSETIIDYIEVFANLDDGIEWFGGTVNVRHAVVSFCGDDSFDYDQSWDGKGQFWFTIQDDLSNRAGEWDGSEKADLTPKASPELYNLTLIGAGSASVNDDGNDALRIRDDGAAQVYNSIFTSFSNRAIVIDNDNTNDSYKRLQDGDILFSQNAFHNFGSGSTFADIVTTDGGDDNILISQLNDNGNVIADPELGGISRIPNQGLDPRLNVSSFALSGAVYPEGQSFAEEVSYLGAFGNNNNWANNWTALDTYGYFGNLVEMSSVVEVGENELGVKLGLPSPNPIRNEAYIDFELPGSTDVSIQIYDLTGKLVDERNLGNFPQGSSKVHLQTGRFANGLYLFALITEMGTVVQKFAVFR